MKISVVGTGYVGLVSGACFAALGHDVVCVDNDQDKIKLINSGVSPIHEEGLEALLADNLGSRLSVSDDIESAVLNTDVTFIAVGTPFDGSTIDLKFVREVARDIGSALQHKSDYHVVVVKSTVVPGTTDNDVKPILEEESGKKAGTGFGLGMNPEFLTEGVAVHDFMNPDRIVIGGIDDASREKLRSIYEVFPDCPVVETNNCTAEMIKYASNALLATLISFSNEIANLGSKLGSIDSVEVMRGVHLSNYLSIAAGADQKSKAPICSFLEAGCGFGGSCLPKDVQALVAQGESLGVPMGLLREVIRVNKEQVSVMLSKLELHLPDLAGKRVGILGLAFKPDTNDIRESPAIPLIKALNERDAIVVAYDPVAIPEAKKHIGALAIEYSESMSALVSGVDAILVTTRWQEFSGLGRVMKEQSRDIPVIDGRRMLRKSDFSIYDGIGL